MKTYPIRVTLETLSILSETLFKRVGICKTDAEKAKWGQEAARIFKAKVKAAEETKKSGNLDL